MKRGAVSTCKRARATLPRRPAIIHPVRCSGMPPNLLGASHTRRASRVTLPSHIAFSRAMLPSHMLSTQPTSKKQPQLSDVPIGLPSSLVGLPSASLRCSASHQPPTSLPPASHQPPSLSDPCNPHPVTAAHPAPASPSGRRPGAPPPASPAPPRPPRGPLRPARPWRWPDPCARRGTRGTPRPSAPAGPRRPCARAAGVWAVGAGTCLGCSRARAGFMSAPVRPPT